MIRLFIPKSKQLLIYCSSLAKFIDKTFGFFLKALRANANIAVSELVIPFYH